ncbi:MAG TPA: MlaD family protein [Steroidobacteraceae bacterium]|nr:MlaD family protein [Steroidobacteraceae bacterium]
MERDANYVAVGAFTLLVIAMATAFVMWYSDSGDRRDYTPYEIYFSGSVAGLGEGSAVRYLGVDVGTVRRITLSKDRPDSVKVKVLVSIDSTVPISGNTRASLGLQGITGLLYINLKQVPGPNGELQNGDKYPVIESQSSDIDAFLASLPQLAGRVGVLLENINKIFSDDNVKAIGDTLNNLRRASSNLPHASEQLQALLTELSETSSEIKSAAASATLLMNDVRPNVREAVSRLNAVSAQLASTTERLDRFMANSEVPMTHFTQQGLFEMERTLRDVRSAAVEFRDLSRSLKQTPSQLMFEKPESGVEIKP